MSLRDTAVLDFVDELGRVWKAAGPPSYQAFEKLSMRVKGPAETDQLWMSRSTTQDILAGRRQQLPKWCWVARFITVLRVSAKEGGVDPESIGTLAEWKQKHESASAAAAANQRLARVAGGEALMLDPLGGARRRAAARRRAMSLLLNDDAERDPELTKLLEAVGREWWCDYADLVPAWLRAYLSLEPAASLIRAYETTLVPGWLQTEAYAAAAIKLSWPGLGKSDVTRLVELRMRRRQFLDQPDGARLWAIVEETAIRRRVGDIKTMRTQIRYLMEILEQTNIKIQVIPVDTTVHAVAGGPITFLRFPPSDLPDVVYLEQLTGALYLPRQRDIVHYRKVLSALAVEALEPAATRDFLREILMEL